MPVLRVEDHYPIIHPVEHALKQGVTLRKLKLRGLPTGDVGVGSEHPKRLSRAIPFDDTAPVAYPHPPAGAMAHAHLARVQLPLPGEMLGQHGLRLREVVRLRELLPGINGGRGKLLERVAEHCRPALVDRDRPGVDVPGPGSGAGSRECLAQAHRGGAHAPLEAQAQEGAGNRGGKRLHDLDLRLRPLHPPLMRDEANHAQRCRRGVPHRRDERGPNALVPQPGTLRYIIIPKFLDV
jgi:hypothetical protein